MLQPSCAWTEWQDLQDGSEWLAPPFAHQLYMHSVQPQDPCTLTHCLQAAEVSYGRAMPQWPAEVCCAVVCCAVPCRWVFLGEGLPSITFALLLPCLLPGGPGKMRSSRWLSHAELQLLRADVSLAGWRQQLLQKARLLWSFLCVDPSTWRSRLLLCFISTQRSAELSAMHLAAKKGLLGRVACR